MPFLLRGDLPVNHNAAAVRKTRNRRLSPMQNLVASSYMRTENSVGFPQTLTSLNPRSLPISVDVYFAWLLTHRPGTGRLGIRGMKGWSNDARRSFQRCKKLGMPLGSGFPRLPSSHQSLNSPGRILIFRALDSDPSCPVPPSLSGEEQKNTQRPNPISCRKINIRHSSSND